MKLNKAIAFTALLLLSACASQVSQRVVESVPVAPVGKIEGSSNAGNQVIQLRTLLHTQDVRYPYFGYFQNGEHFGSTQDEVIFPTDILVVLVDGEIRHVFLARSPHGGCPIRWVGGWPWSETNEYTGEAYFDEGCFGSHWNIDGEWIMGPSPRNMDELPFEVKEGMLWVTGEIIYGDPHE